MTDYVDYAGDMLQVQPDPGDEGRLSFLTLSRQGEFPVELDRGQVWQLQHELQSWLGERPELPTRKLAPSIGALLWIGAVLAAVFCAGGMILN